MQKSIDRIWWRNVQIGEFYNIERFQQIKGGGGSLYIEIPSSLVPDTLSFLGVETGSTDDVDTENLNVITIQARVMGAPEDCPSKSAIITHSASSCLDCITRFPQCPR